MLASIYLIGILYPYEMFITFMFNINTNDYFIICTHLQGSKEVTGLFLLATMSQIWMRTQ
jgi:hypothetical protein